MYCHATVAVAPSLEDPVPIAPVAHTDVPKSFNYGPFILKPALQFNDEPVKNCNHSTITRENVIDCKDLKTIIDAMPPREGEIALDERPGIRFAPGHWMRAPKAAQMPKLSGSFCRMGSIPHGTNINGIHITPILFPLGNGPQEIEIEKAKRKFNSQDAHNDATRRLPQDLDLFVKNGTITQAILDDPNKILRDANESKDIIENTMFIVSTNAPADAFGGGTTNIGFNIGADSGLKREPFNSGNDNAVDVMAQYWVSTIRTQVELDPSMKIGQTVSPAAQDPRDAVPEFFLDKNITIPSSRKTVTVAHTQIQYSQMVFLDFNGIKWPHVTVATLASIVHLENQTLSSAIKAAQV
ncbi:hypothetical protein FHETE_11153 [Fusarium heterosporum]|uniref:Uncharacterized protein n=1 Tax=Fusarium heterosporum TaxID=42747 RepID=A0A8H5SQ51_FUSHE|nr:hypothetical protein FHETE_11153 [Fusarium heterosporum]